LYLYNLQFKIKRFTITHKAFLKPGPLFLPKIITGAEPKTSQFPKCNIDCGFVFATPIRPPLVILTLSERLPIEKIILFPVFALMPKFPVFCHIEFPVSKPPNVKPPAYT
jgi:hypothetical protein